MQKSGLSTRKNALFWSRLYSPQPQPPRNLCMPHQITITLKNHCAALLTRWLRLFDVQARTRRAYWALTYGVSMSPSNCARGIDILFPVLGPRAIRENQSPYRVLGLDFPTCDTCSLPRYLTLASVSGEVPAFWCCPEHHRVTHCT
jgi:hypothetical protein